MTNLKKALSELQEERTSEYEALLDQQPEHHFSRGYRRRRSEIVAMASRKAKVNTNEFKFRTVSRFSFRSAMVAVIVMILASASVIAIAKPEIIFNIKEKFTHWDIDVVQKNADEASDEFVPIKPDAPKGYEITSEELGSYTYLVIYEDKEGNEIAYDQGTSSSKIYLDSEGIDTYETTINGHKAIISRHSVDATTIIIEDGVYVYLLSGHCPFEDVYDFAEKLPTLN